MYSPLKAEWQNCRAKSNMLLVTKTFQCLLQSMLQEIGTIALGLFVILSVCIVYIISIPIFLFRLLLIKLAPVLRPELGNIISAQGNIFSSDLFSSNSPRCTIVVPIVIDGQFSTEELLSIFARMLDIENKETGRKTYPEFKQYLEKWFGFPFWRNDSHFDIRNHIVFHTFGEGEVKTEGNVIELTERLLNKKFPSEKSPWEFYVVNNYQDPNLPLRPKDRCTLILFRIHHTMADGFAIVKSLVEGICNIPFNQMDLPTPNYVKREKLSQIFYTMTIPLRLVFDVSYYLVKIYRKNPLSVQDNEKSWEHIYGKSPSYPMEKIKTIKNQLNVSFTSVLLAAISASISRIIKAKQHESKRNGETKEMDQENIERASFFIPLPLQGHPNELRNHVTGAQIDLPMDNFSDPTLRVVDCENQIKQQKYSTIPMMLVLVAKTLGLLPSTLCGMLTANKVNVGGLTSFPAGRKALIIGDTGKNVLSVELAAGALTGVSGVAFMAISYVDRMNFAVTAENAVLSRKDVDGLLTLLVDELDLLYEIAVENKLELDAPTSKD